MREMMKKKEFKELIEGTMSETKIWNAWNKPAQRQKRDLCLG